MRDAVKLCLSKFCVEHGAEERYLVDISTHPPDLFKRIVKKQIKLMSKVYSVQIFMHSSLLWALLSKPNDNNSTFTNFASKKSLPRKLKTHHTDYV